MVTFPSAGQDATEMQVLVDFDNLPASVQLQGAVYVADRALQSLGPFLSVDRRLDFRLYGGWDEGGKLTPRAQLLHAELVASFPRAFGPGAGSPPTAIVATAALAQSLLAEPALPLRDTYRLRPPARRMFCDSPADHGCAVSACPIVAAARFIETRNCPVSGCPIEFDTVVRGHSEQKVVDTAIVGDLLHLASRSERAVAVLSSDDDMWPGIAGAMRQRVMIYHIDARGRGPSRYACGHRPFYKCVPF